MRFQLSCLTVAEKAGAPAEGAVRPHLELHAIGQRHENDADRLTAAAQQGKRLSAIFVNAIACGCPYVSNVHSVATVQPEKGAR